MSKLFIESVPTEDNKIAFTYDDGPDPNYTESILELLEKYNAKATFFMIGEQIEKYKDIVKEVAYRGHEIGNHTFHHHDLTSLGKEAIESELAKTDQCIREIVKQTPVSFRPPFMAWNETADQVARQFSYSIIGARNFSAKDWENPGIEWIVNETKRQIQPGSIFIFHDGYGDRTQTVEATKRLLEEYAGEYQFVTVRHLLGK